jgi:peroxiredoxin
VSATICGYRRFPLGGFGSLADDLMPLVALARSGPTGLVEVSGHTAVEVDATGTGAPNAIVYFPDGSGTGQIGALMQAITESRRYDAPTAVVVAMSSSQLKSVPYTEGVTYADDDAGRWKRRFGVRDARSPVTLIVNPEGKVVWKHEGEIDRASLTETLRKHLVARAPLKPNMLAANARIGQPPPNFLFDYAQGRQLTLRKLAGRPVVIVFWRSTSEPSIAAVRDAKENLADDDTLVLAINDGEKPDAALRGGAQAGLSATVVVDPHREISRAYGVAIWPTTFVIDSDGVLRAIRYGRDNYPSSPTNQSAGNDRGGAK